MFKKMMEALEKANVRAKLKKGGLRCPDCGSPAGDLPNHWDEVMACKSCGARASLGEWAGSYDSEQRAGFADQPPAGTKIRRETIGDDQVIWHIPAVGKFGFFLFFAIFWLLITGAVSGGFLLAFITGKKIDGDGPGWLIIPFFGLFWAVGLGMLYAAFRNKYMKHTVTFGGERITLKKDMFGRTSEKSLARSSVSSVSQKEFYQQNYKAVYGIEIRGSEGKLRFGSALSAEDKSWLVADFKRVLARREKSESVQETGDASRGLAPIKVGTGKSPFSIAIPKPGASAVIGSLIFAIMGIGFVCIGIFLIEGEPMPEELQGRHGGFEWFFFLMANGFRTFWILFCSVFAVIGIGMTCSTLRARGKDRRIEGDEEKVSIRTYRKGLTVENRSFPRNLVHDIRGAYSGSSNGNTKKRVELVVGNKTEKIASWMDGDMADRLIEEVRTALAK
jgi:uncharacterized membrane protein